MRILVADDDRVIVTLIAGLLRQKGHEAVPVFDAMQAVMFAARPPPVDAIILDIHMPGGTGIEAIRRLKSLPKTALIPLVVLSGSTDPALPDKVKADGADAFLSKPVDPAQLFATLERLVPAGGAPSQR